MSTSVHTGEPAKCTSTVQSETAANSGRLKEGGVLPSWSIARIAVGIYLARTLGEALAGVASTPFIGSKGLKETPAISAQDTELNRYLLSECPALQQFVASPWAPGAISQTVLGLLVNSGSNDYNRRNIVEAEDGVQLILDWKEQPGLPPDTPILLILHGIGGGSDSRMARCLSDEVRRQGWRAAVYNRRGHGQSSLLPGPLAPPEPGKVRTRSSLRTDMLAKPLSMLKEALPASVAITISAARTTAAAAVNKLLTPLSNGGMRSPSPPVAIHASATTTTNDSGTLPLTQGHASTTSAEVFAVLEGQQQGGPCRAGSDPPSPLPEGMHVCIEEQRTHRQSPGLHVANGIPGQRQVDTHLSANDSMQQHFAIPSTNAVQRTHDSNVTIHAGARASEQAAQGQDSPSGRSGLEWQRGAAAGMGSSSASINNLNQAVHQGGTPGAGTTTPVMTAAAAVMPNGHNSPKQAAPAGDVQAMNGHPAAAAAAVDLHSARKRSSARTVGVEMLIPPKVRRTESLQQVKKIFPRHSDTEDLREIIDFIHAAYPSAPIVALGFSQGSNVLVHYLGSLQDGSSGPTPLVAALSISNAYDILEGTTHLCRDWVTDAVVTRPIKRLLQKELHAVQQLVDAHGIQVDVQRALSAHSIREFDEALVVPAYGFTCLEDYYATQSCKGYLQGVQIPMLLVNNLDDPIIHQSLTSIAEEASKQNPWLVSVCTKRGGHLGWLQEWRGHGWLLDVMMQYARSAVSAATKGLLQGADTKSPALRHARSVTVPSTDA